MRSKKSIIGIILLVVVLVDISFVFGFQISRFAKADKKIKELNEKIVAFERDLQAKPNLLASKENLESEIMLTESHFLAKEEVTYILSEINKVAKKTGIDIKNTRLEEQEDAGGSFGVSFFYLPVSVSVVASYHQFGSFLNELERKEIPIRLKEVVVSGFAPELQIKAVLVGVAKEK